MFSIEFEQRIATLLAVWCDNARGMSGVDVAFLAEHSIGRAVRAEAARTGEFDPVDRYGWALRHAFDWIVAAAVNELPWLSVLDENEVPRKFSKFTNVKRLLEEAERGHARLARDAPKVARSKDGETLVENLGNGYSLVRLLTPAALDDESAQMQHCIGQGGYDQGLENGSIMVLSLRDPSGRPHVTMEVDRRRHAIVELKGKQNKVPIPTYWELLDPWFVAAGYAPPKFDIPSGSFFDTARGLRMFAQLKEGETINGDVHVVLKDGGETLAVPEGLMIVGNLEIISPGENAADVVFSHGVRVTKNVVVRGARVTGAHLVGCHKMSLFGCQLPIHALPVTFRNDVVLNGTQPGGRFRRATFAKDCQITSLVDLHIGSAFDFAGDLSILACGSVSIDKSASFAKDLTMGNCGSGGGEVTIGEDVIVPGEFRFESGSVTLGERVSAGSMKVSSTDMRGVPQILSVDGPLALKNVRCLSKIPRHWNLGGDVTVVSTDIAHVDGRTRWNGDLTLQRNQVRSLPEGTVVEGSLDLSTSLVTALPRDLVVGGNFEAAQSHLADLPPTASIGGNIGLRKSRVKAIPDGLRVNGSLDIREVALERHPVGVIVDGLLMLADTAISDVARHYVAGSYSFTDCDIGSLGNIDHPVEDIWIVKGRVGEFPERLTVSGDLLVSWTKLDAPLPAGVSAGGQIRVEGSDRGGGRVMDAPIPNRGP